LPFVSRPRARLCALLVAVVAVTALAGCSDDGDAAVDPAQVDSVEAPEAGACRVLTPEDVARPGNAGRVVGCTEPHTAETFLVATFPKKFTDAEYTDQRLGGHAYKACSTAFQKHLGADESLVMRSILSWAWFRPSEKAWEDGARWFRCDVIGGGDQMPDFVDLPESTQDLFLGKPKDHWMVCADGPSVAGTVKIPCSEPHTWRAVTTIKVGQDKDPYPGDRLVEVRTRDYCSKSVGAWLNYPDEFDYAYTWFHQAEWDAGNRRSICWARTRR